MADPRLRAPPHQRETVIRVTEFGSRGSSGSVRSEDGTCVEHTRFTSISNLTHLHHIVRGAGDPTPRLIDVGATDLSGGTPRHFPLPVEDFQTLTI